jgi:hypothetical protein
VETVDVSKALALLWAVKDKTEMEYVQGAAQLSSAVCQSKARQKKKKKRDSLGI